MSTEIVTINDRRYVRIAVAQGKPDVCYNCSGLSNFKLCREIREATSCDGYTFERVRSIHNPYEDAVRYEGDVQSRWKLQRSCPSTAWFDVYKQLRVVIQKHRPGYGRWPDMPRAIELAFAKLGRPTDMHELALQWPHNAISDKYEGKVAFTQNDRGFANDRQVVTTWGKYLRRHWPKAEDHQIRDIVAMSAPDTYEIWATTEQIVESAQKGPTSCMKWTDGEIDCDGDGHHPYEVYAPRLGWSVAVRLKADLIVGRCLMWTNPSTGKSYSVRSYMAEGDNPNSTGYSHADPGLDAWMVDKGIKRVDSWPDGTPFAKIDGNSDVFMPYVDGSHHNIRDDGSVYRMDEDGQYECANTDGTVEGCRREECDDCGSHQDPDDMYWAGQHEDHHVCSSCRDDYVTVRTGRYESVAMRPDDDDAVEFDGDYYLRDNLSRFDLVELEDGDIARMDEAYCTVDGDWVSADDVGSSEDRHDEEYTRTHPSEDVIRLADAVWCAYNEAWVAEDDATEVEDGVYVFDADVDAWKVDQAQGELDLEGAEEPAASPLA